jgi:glycosyltransferase involved in cell wall biosynthesis
VSGSTSLRVLLCTTGFPRFSDDANKPFLLDHARALTGQGATVTVVCPSGPDLPDHQGLEDIEIVRFRYGPRNWETLAGDESLARSVAGPGALKLPSFLAGFGATAAVAAKRRGVDVVHAHSWAPSGVVGLVAAAASGAVSVTHLHGNDRAATKGPLAPAAKAVLGATGGVLAASPELAAWAEEIGVEGVEIVPMPLRTGVGFAPSAPPATGPLLGVGRLVPDKGFDLLIRAGAILDEDVVIVGDGPERSALEELANALASRVRFVGEVPPRELPVYYQEARLVVVPDRREDSSLVVAEAAACGRAVVGSRVGGVRDLIVDGVSGVLVPPDDLEALIAGIRSAEPGMGVHGPEQVAHLTPTAHGARLVTIYRQLLAERSEATLM